MKKILTVLLVLAVMTASVFAADPTANLLLGFQKNANANLSVGWYKAVSTNPEIVTEKSFGAGTETPTVYLRSVCNYAAGSYKLSVNMPKLTFEGATTEQQVGYTAALVDRTSDSAVMNLTKNAITENGTDTEFATVSGSASALRTAWTEFTFTIGDNTNAALNTTYNATVVVTMKSAQ